MHGVCFWEKLGKIVIARSGTIVGVPNKGRIQYFYYIWIKATPTMGTAELRSKIIALLDTDNLSYLEDVFDFAKKKKVEAIASFVELPEEIQSLLMKSIEQADRGELIPHAQVMEELRKKYNLP